MATSASVSRRIRKNVAETMAACLQQTEAARKVSRISDTADSLVCQSSHPQSESAIIESDSNDATSGTAGLPQIKPTALASDSDSQSQPLSQSRYQSQTVTQCEVAWSTPTTPSS